jgi:hypothetical protein
MPKTKHGMHNTRLNHIWRQMKYRCTSPKAPEYKNYGGRGIKVSPRWMDSFQAFLDDMGSTYEEHLTLDRIDNNGDYGPDNCKWASYKEQHRNRRDNHNLEAFGKVQSIAAWSEEYGIPVNTLKNRMYRSNKKKLTLEEALTISTYAQQRGVLK